MAHRKSEIVPLPWPRAGQVQRLYINVAKGVADVFVHQTRWPRQPQNPNFRFEVRGVDARLDDDTQARITFACEDTARLYLSRWLAEVAPLLTIETVTWPELVKLATESRRSAPSAYQKRHSPTVSPSRARAPQVQSMPTRRRAARTIALEVD